MPSHSSSSPLFVRADTSVTGGFQPSTFRRWSCIARRYSAAVRVAAGMRSPSCLFTTRRSAISMIPFLTPCSSSPPAGGITRVTTSTAWSIKISLWPSPTVSTMTVPYPALWHSCITSCVYCATPPRMPEEGEGRTNACSWRESSAMRVLSPKMLPPDRCDDGSMVITASFSPELAICMPRFSIRVDLPAPGGPQMPRRRSRGALGAWAWVCF
mmetsp:Transcript_5039/g.11033  ORF Transcript_5039/g.11033 Transcript_5039/m.11033 type:complete len:213 (+) Transcript_5039:659-1297(+)